MPQAGEYFLNDPSRTSTTLSSASAQDWQTTYSNIISLYIPYYSRLPEELRKKFLERTFQFRSLKNFHFVGITEQAEIPILISAAAVQLTLGLEKYELAFFKDIYITLDAYKSGDATELYVGHVAPNGIYLSWKYFLQGFSDSQDNVNVAIHELAHALAHESFIEESGVDWDFRTDFARFSEQSGPEMVKWLMSRKSFLRPYAFTNFQEFWAVAVEAFFESPAEFKRQMPELYGSLCNVLNQDPLSSRIVISQH
jgi:Mlc titration factor MtfA (ptsG expression regulator)